jgi:RNA polymerase sigma-70 factor (ECF subfamily)
LQSEHDIGSRKKDFETAAEEAYPALARAATVLCWSQADVEDVVQEALLRAFKSYGAFRGDSSFFTWAYAILSRAAQAANRAHTKGVPSDYALSQPQHLPPVDRAVVLNEDARAVIEAIRSLPERQREMVTLRFLEDLGYAEIAATLAVSVGTVKATLFEAKMSLRSALARQGIRKKASHVVP